MTGDYNPERHIAFNDGGAPEQAAQFLAGVTAELAGREQTASVCAQDRCPEFLGHLTTAGLDAESAEDRQRVVAICEQNGGCAGYIDEPSFLCGVDTPELLTGGKQ